MNIDCESRVFRPFFFNAAFRTPTLTFLSHRLVVIFYYGIILRYAQWQAHKTHIANEKHIQHIQTDC